MANSMDAILIKYSGSKELISIQDFFKKGPEELTEFEQKVKEALQEVYKLNGKKPPLYKDLPTHDPKKPLTINCLTAVPSSTAGAYYSYAKHEVCFVLKRGDLVATIAHELKHAEQDQAGMRQISSNDNRKKQEIFAMDEAEAFFTGAYAHAQTSHKIPDSEPELFEKYLQVLKKCARPDGTADYLKVKREFMALAVPYIALKLKDYPIQREVRYPVTPKDVGLQHIPKHYELDDSFLDVLKKIPREAKTDLGKISQCVANNQKDLLIPTLQEIIKKSGLAPDKVKREILGAFLNPHLTCDRSVVHELIQLKKNKAMLAPPVFGKDVITDVLCDSVRNGKECFEYALSVFQNEDDLGSLRGGKLSFTAEDFKGGQKLLNGLKNCSFEQKSQMLPFLVGFKGDDGVPLIAPQELVRYLADLCARRHDPKDIQGLFESLKDKQGRLPVIQDDCVFDWDDPSKEGENIILYEIASRLKSGVCLPSTYEKNREYYLKILPILASLKGKDGKPVISQEAIRDFLHNDIANADRQVQIRQRSQTKTRSGTPNLRTTSQGKAQTPLKVSIRQSTRSP